MKIFRIINKAWIKGQFQWEPHDLWVGIFWRNVYEMPEPFLTLHIYICIIPLIPFHLTILLKWRQPNALRDRTGKQRDYRKKEFNKDMRRN